VKYHPEVCVQKEISCPNDCGQNVNAQTRNSHIMECMKMLMNCDSCGKVIVRSEAGDHFAECPEVFEHCKECEEVVKRQNL